MYLVDTINLMCTSDVNDERNITIYCYGSNKMVYRGALQWFHDYIDSHNNMIIEDNSENIFDNVHDIDKWIVVEIRVDDSYPKESGLPDYNKSKIISII